MFLVVLILLKIISWQPIKAQDWNLIQQNLLAIKEDCGEVCDTSENMKVIPGSIFDQVEKHIECDRIFFSKYIDAQDDTIFSDAPRKQNIPENIIELFTYNRSISIHETYFNQAYFSRPTHNTKMKIWDKKLFENFRELYKNRPYMNHQYGPEITHSISEMMDKKMIDKVRTLENNLHNFLCTYLFNIIFVFQIR